MKPYAAYAARMSEQNVASKASQQAIVDAACEGSVLPISFVPVKVSDGDHELLMFGMGDALKIGNADDYVRPNVSHETAQKLADILSLVVPTATMMDALADQAPLQVDAMAPHLIDPRRSDGVGGGNFIRSEPVPGSIEMSRGSMEEESTRMDAMLRELGVDTPAILPPGMGLNQVGKVWITAHKAKGSKPLGVNYGFYSKKGPRSAMRSSKWRVWQQPGTFHGAGHADYSQRAVFFSPMAQIRGGDYGNEWVDIDLDVVATKPSLAHLVHHEKLPMKLRHPLLPRYDRECRGAAIANGARPSKQKQYWLEPVDIELSEPTAIVVDEVDGPEKAVEVLKREAARVAPAGATFAVREVVFNRDGAETYGTGLQKRQVEQFRVGDSTTNAGLGGSTSKSSERALIATAAAGVGFLLSFSLVSSRGRR